METELIKWIHLKTKNKRLIIELWFNKNEKNHYFKVETYTLIDFKKRQILETHNLYSVETFLALSHAFSMFAGNSEITNKILHLEILKCNKFSGNKNL